MKESHFMPLDIISVGNYYAEVADDSLADLRERLKPLCKERYRRIDRFIQLSLLGSALCANALADDEINSETACYIASELAAMSNTAKVQEQIFLQGEQAKPAQFINTLSNSAGFYVARNLNLTGRNIFVSRQNASFEAAVQLIAQDFQTGACPQALLGAVDECVLPVAQHRQRLGLESNASLAEGSHWFLLRPALEATENSSTECIATIQQAVTLANETQLLAWLESLPTSEACVYASPESLALSSVLPPQDCSTGKPLANYGARNAGAACDFVLHSKFPAMVSVAADRRGRFHALYITK